MIQHDEGGFSLLAFGRSGLFGPPLCGGSAPATPPLLQPRVVASGWAIRDCRPVSAYASPRLLADSENVPSASKTGEAAPIYAQSSPRLPSRACSRIADGTFPPGRLYTEHGPIVTFSLRSLSTVCQIPARRSAVTATRYLESSFCVFARTSSEYCLPETTRKSNAGDSCASIHRTDWQGRSGLQSRPAVGVGLILRIR